MEVKPGYKQTEVGIIPEEWEVFTIGKTVTLVNGRAFKPSDWKTHGLPIIRIQNLNDPMAAYNYYEGNVEERYYVNNGDILFAWSGTKESSFGARMWRGQTAILNQHIFRVIPNEAKLSSQYVLLALKRFQEDIERKSHGFKSSFVHIRKSDLESTFLAVPPLPEQRSIATVLSDMDALLGTLDQLIAKKRDLKQATMQQLLTGKKRLPGFDGEWDVKQLGDLGTFLKGSGIKKDDALSGHLPCIRYGEIYTHHNNYIKSFNSWISPKVAETATRIKQGDLLFAGSGETKEEIGKCVAFIDDMEAYAGGDIVILRPLSGNAMFLGYYCNTSPINSQKASKGQGDAVVHISANALSSIEVSLPSFAEQTAIATVLSDMDTELAALEQRRDKTRALKQGMMQELLTGRTRLQ